MKNQYGNIEIFVLAHGIPNCPVWLDEMEVKPGCIEILRGSGVENEVFDKLMEDEMVILQIGMWCEEEGCNQVVLSREGYPEGFLEGYPDGFPPNTIIEILRN